MKLTKEKVGEYLDTLLLPGELMPTIPIHFKRIYLYRKGKDITCSAFWDFETEFAIRMEITDNRKADINSLFSIIKRGNRTIYLMESLGPRGVKILKKDKFSKTDMKVVPANQRCDCIWYPIEIVKKK